MDKRQKKRQEYRKLPLGYYHLCTDGWGKGKLFHNRKQFALGMTAIALVSLRYNVKIYVFALMPNHIHILLSATGNDCVEVFDFLLRRINKQLKEDGYPPLPEDYDFQLLPIKDQESFRDHFIYIARNYYEKGFVVPGGCLWCSDYLLFSQWADLIRGERVDDMSQRKVRGIIKSEMSLPAHWEIHPEWGVLPRNFVSMEKVKEMFPSVKTYLTRLIKDYESFVHISDTLGEQLCFSEEEIKEIIEQLREKNYPHRSLKDLSADEKSRLAIILNEMYHFDAATIARLLHISQHIVSQVLRSKDFASRRR